MRIITDAKSIMETLSFVSLSGATKEDTVDRLRSKKDDAGNIERYKEDRHGNKTYSVDVKVLDDGREERDVYLSVREPSDFPALTPLKPVGEVEINTFGTRTGMITTIVVDRFEPANAPAPKLNIKGGGE